MSSLSSVCDDDLIWKFGDRPMDWGQNSCLIASVHDDDQLFITLSYLRDSVWHKKNPVIQHYHCYFKDTRYMVKGNARHFQSQWLGGNLAVGWERSELLRGSYCVTNPLGIRVMNTFIHWLTEIKIGETRFLVDFPSVSATRTAERFTVKVNDQQTTSLARGLLMLYNAVR